MEYQEVKKRLTAAQDILSQPGLNLSTLQSVQTLIAGINPQLDKKLIAVTHQFSKVYKLQSGQIIELSADFLPERDEKEKKRKKALLLFIQSIKDLQSEVTRVKEEMDTSFGSRMGQARAISRIIAFAKGPLGVITAFAVVVVLAATLLKKPARTPSASPQTPITSYIIVEGHKVTLDQVFIGTGSDCDAPHYHAKNEVSVMSTDGTTIPDPDGCGYGKVASTPVVKM